MKTGDPSKDYRALDQMGLFTVPYYDPFNHEILGCVGYDSRSEWDTNFKLARTNAIFLLISLSMVAILYTLSMLFLLHERSKFIIHWICRCLVVASLIFNTLLFIVFGGDDCKRNNTKCPPGTGAILAMVNEFALLAMTVLWVMVPPPTFPYFLRSSSVFSEEGDGDDVMREGSVFSVPEIVKAKRVIQREHRHKKNIKQQQQQQTRSSRTINHPNKKRHASNSTTSSLQTDMAQNDNKEDYAPISPTPPPPPPSNYRDGSSSPTFMMTDDIWDEEEGIPNNNYAQKYCAPSRSPGKRQCV